jgi:hypothetical protein
MTEPRLRIAAGAAIIAFLVLVTAPYLYLVETFRYDDILREPAGIVLDTFHAGGRPLVLAWLCFSIAALSFVAVAIALGRWLNERTGAPQQAAMLFGAVSATLQAVGLARWAFVVPALAARHADPTATEAERQVLEAIFQTVHQYGGVAIGEHLGQLTLVVWTAIMAAQFLRMNGAWKLLGLLPAATIPLWLVAQTELLHAANPAFPAVEAAPFAFMLWQAWLLALGLTLVAGSLRSTDRRRPATA